MVAGGPGMTGNITVQAVYIGTPRLFVPCADRNVRNHNFLTSGVFASQMGWLSAEYGVGSIATIEPDIVITNPQSTNFTQSYGVVSGTDIQSEIDWQLANSGSSSARTFPRSIRRRRSSSCTSRCRGLAPVGTPAAPTT